MSETASLHPLLLRWRYPALGAGIVALAVALLALIKPEWRPHFFLAYLMAYMFWLGIGLGCFVLIMLQHLTGGKWGLAIRRVAESGMRMAPVMAILFIPIILGMKYMYVWHLDGFFEYDPSPIRKHWLRIDFFIIRAVIYFAVWIFLSFILDRWSVREDRAGFDPESRKYQRVSAFGIVLYGLTISGAAVDWVMSLAPHWFSTIFGMIFMVGQVLSALCVLVVVLTLLTADHGPLADVVHPGIFQDLGNLMLAFTMLWAYCAFSQLLIMWNGNISSEITFYVFRVNGIGWRLVAALLILFHFCLPFVILLSRFVKRRGRYLSMVAIFILFMRLVDLLWMILPSYYQGQYDLHHPIPTFIHSFHWAYLITPIGIGGIWYFFFVWQLGRRPLIPLHDPRLAEVAHHA